MNQIGQVAEAGRPKLTVSQYRTTYKNHIVEICLDYAGEWFFTGMHSGHRNLNWESHKTPEDALKAAMSWVDTQDPNAHLVHNTRTKA